MSVAETISADQQSTTDHLASKDNRGPPITAPPPPPYICHSLGFVIQIQVACMHGKLQRTRLPGDELSVKLTRTAPQSSDAISSQPL